MAATSRCALCGARSEQALCELAGETGPGAGVDCQRYPARAGIFAQGEPADAAHCVRAGIVKLYKTGARGEQLIIRLLGPGHLIGYRAVLAEEPYAASAEALDEVELCSIAAGTFRALLAGSPAASARLLAMMARELRLSEEQALAIAQETVRARTVRLLIGFLDDTGRDAQAGESVLVPLPRWELAQMVAATPETLSRTLHRLAKEGLLTLSRSAIAVRDPQRLRAIARR